jgi:hypothetical protein
MTNPLLCKARNLQMTRKIRDKKNRKDKKRKNKKKRKTKAQRQKMRKDKKPQRQKTAKTKKPQRRSLHTYSNSRQNMTYKKIFKFLTSLSITIIPQDFSI